MRYVTTMLLLVAGLLFAPQARADAPAGPASTQPPVGPLSFTMKNLGGKDVDLSTYRAKVVMMVNVASKCGYTPQYKPLEALYIKYSKQGFVILGFPANNFGSQEPGTDTEISTFCTVNYGVTFDMFSKISVKGKDIAPLYLYLTGKETDPQFAGDIGWNFTKFLIDRNGKLVNRFESKVVPDDPIVVAAIEKELAKPAP